uniref:Uncharacterized protein n=1 Tax=Rhizophora mucronata TaxID=61149 RepID=A0A2P2NY66_RHIMU
MLSFACRMTHPGQGLPFALIQDMIEGEDRWNTQEGLRLNLSQKLLNTMNGHVRYLREQNKSSFLIDLELRSKKGDYRSCKKIK